MIQITDFESLVSAAKQQPDPQRLLFVFLKVSLPKDHLEEQAERFQQGQGGALEALMCVDKSPNELGSFAELVKESDEMQQEWQIVLVAGLGGRDGRAPSDEEAEAALKSMVKVVETAGDLSRFMAFGRDGLPVNFG